MTLTSESCIEPCNEPVENLPEIMLNIVPLNNLSEKNANDYVDVIGIIKSCGDLSTIIVKATNKELLKREITLVDDSNCSISCTLWGKQVGFLNFFLL